MTASKLRHLVLSILYLLSFSFASSAVALADSRPYYKAYGADIFSGGWFNAAAVACDPNSASYQSPDLSGTPNYRPGGVMAYANKNGSGAGSQYGALALGLIEGNGGSGEPYGFLSAGTSNSQLSFANFSSLSGNVGGSTYWGGFLEGTTRQTHCIPDYFSTKQSTAIDKSVTSGSVDVANLASRQYLISPSGVLDVNASTTIGGGKKTTVFVNGNVFISSNISYANRSTYTADTVPKFALVVKGSIYIAPTVNQLDGLYIAQPDNAAANPVTGDTGVIWTCHTNNTNTPTDAFISLACRNKLTFNGSVIAKQVNLLRVNGDVATAAADEDAGNGNIAEVFNYTPETVTGGGFFNSDTGSKYKIESLISLPPVF